MVKGSKMKNYCSGALQLVDYLKANKYSAYVLLAMVFVHLSNQYDRYLFSVAEIPFVDYDSYEYALLAGPIFTTVNTISGVLISFLGEVRRVRVLCLAALVWNISTMLVASSGALWQVTLARIGQGLGDAACNPFAAAILRDHFDAGVIGAAMGVYYVGLYAGYSLALSVGTLGYLILGWKMAYALAGATGVLVVVVIYKTVKEPVLSVDRRAFVPLNVDTNSTSGSRVGEGVHNSQEGAMEATKAIVVEGDSEVPLELRAGNRGGSPMSALDACSVGSSQGRPLLETAPLSPDSPTRCRNPKLATLAESWLGSPSLILVCVAGGVRDAGGFVFSYYLSSFFSPLFDRRPILGGDGICEFSYNPLYEGDQMCDENYPWCVDSACQRLASGPWRNEGLQSYKLAMFVSWIPLVGGSIGAMLGGLASDYAAKHGGTPGRLRVVFASNALATPFAAGVLLFPYPWCFMSLLCAELLGEMWIGVVLTVVMALVPRGVRVTSVALYNFIITNISGLAAALVPMIRAYYETERTFYFNATSAIGTSPVAMEVRVSDSTAGAEGLRSALLWMYPGFFFASAVVCLVAATVLHHDTLYVEVLDGTVSGEADMGEGTPRGGGQRLEGWGDLGDDVGGAGENFPRASDSDGSRMQAESLQGHLLE